MKTNTAPILSALQRVLGPNPAPLHEPSFIGNEWKYTKDCLDTGWVSSVGKYVDEIEFKLAAYTGARFAIATSNGTSALHTCLKLLGVGNQDEVLMPALTFVATANAISYTGAVPHFVDSSPKTLGICPIKLREYLKNTTTIEKSRCISKASNRRIAALILVHVFGHPAQPDEILEVCNDYHIELIEDAAESLGSFHKGKHTGLWGRLATLSFNGNKIVTTGGGGAIITQDEVLAKKAKHITTTAKLAHAWEYAHDEVGFNYRMPNINAALGLAQLESLPYFLEKKRILAQRYMNTFKEVESVHFFEEPKDAKSNYWLNAIILDESLASRRDSILDDLNHVGYMSRPTWSLMHRLPMYSDCPRADLSTSENLSKRIINIPSGSALAGRA